MNYSKLRTVVCAGSLLSLGGCGLLETVDLPDIKFDSNTYIVQPGDTLQSVANRYQIDPNALASANAIGQSRLIPGQRLMLIRDEDAFEQLARRNPVADDQEVVMVPAASQANSDAVLKTQDTVVGSIIPQEEIIGVRETVEDRDALLNDEPVFVSELPTLPPPGNLPVALPTLPDPTLINDIRVDQKISKVDRPEGKETIIGQSDGAAGAVVPLADTVAIQDDINVTAAVKRVTVNTRADGWNWPALGQITREFDLREINRQGLDIDTGPGAGVQAAADGEVVYSGRDLASYGNLVILRHKDNFLTAYSKVSDIFVKENQEVKAGDLIAVVGGEQSEGTELHFEIRRNGEPVNPVDYLPTL